jgi:hypothetical protein
MVTANSLLRERNHFAGNSAIALSQYLDAVDLQASDARKGGLKIWARTNTNQDPHWVGRFLNAHSASYP